MESMCAYDERGDKVHNTKHAYLEEGKESTIVVGAMESLYVELRLLYFTSLAAILRRQESMNAFRALVILYVELRSSVSEPFAI